MKHVELDYVFEPVKCEARTRETLLSGMIIDLHISFIPRDTNLVSKLSGLKKGVYLLKSGEYKVRYRVGGLTNITTDDEGLVKLVYYNIIEEVVND